jgi:hypothetical protein
MYSYGQGLVAISHVRPNSSLSATVDINQIHIESASSPGKSCATSYENNSDSCASFDSQRVRFIR